MKIREINFVVIADEKQVKYIGRSIIYQPAVACKGKKTKWLDDSRLIKKGGKSSEDFVTGRKG